MIAKETAVKTPADRAPSLVDLDNAKTANEKAKLAGLPPKQLGEGVTNFVKAANDSPLVKAMGKWFTPATGKRMSPEEAAEDLKGKKLKNEKLQIEIDDKKGGKGTAAKSMKVSEQAKLTSERNRFRWANEDNTGPGEYLWINRGKNDQENWQIATDTDAKYYQAVDKQFKNMYSNLGKDEGPGVTKTLHEEKQPGDGGKFQADPGYDNPEGPKLPEVGNKGNADSKPVSVVDVLTGKGMDDQYFSLAVGNEQWNALDDYYKNYLRSKANPTAAIEVLKRRGIIK
jgi:hypothetical protein